MLLKVAVGLLLTWAAVSVVGIDRIGNAVHVLLLIGLMLLLLGFVKARDAAMPHDHEASKPPRER
jgi:hypothetical protein